jgi:RNA polymerase primary sigma factor
MERDKRQAALRQLLAIAASNGYVTFDDIMRCADDNSLSIGEFDWLAETASSRNVIIYDEAPKPVSSADDDYDDYAQVDYEQTFSEAIEMAPGIELLIESIRRIKPPQRGEVSRLKYQVIEGNVHARERMIEMYLRLAVRLAVSRAKTYDLALEETIGDAFIGLIVAVDKYDPDHSGPFVSFASLWIYQNMSREQSTRNPNLYFPVHRKEWFYTMYPLLKARGCTECDTILQCDKVADMICEKIQCERERVCDVLNAALPCLSLDEMAENDVEDERYSYPDAELIEEVDSRIRSEKVRKALYCLREREREILIDRYGLNGEPEKTLEQVGQKYNLTRERIRQIENKVLKKLHANRYLRNI